MSRLLLSRKEGCRRLALFEGDRLVEYREEEAANGPRAEDILLGRANRVMKSLSAVFMRIGPETEGFLPFGELAGAPQPRPGDSLMVQVKKPPVGRKAAYLTMNIALPGRHALLLPKGEGYRISRRVESEDERQRMKALAKSLQPRGMGLVLREESLQAEEAEVAAELHALRERWEAICLKAQSAAAPCVLEAAPDALTRMLREAKEPLEEILTDDRQAQALPGIPLRYAADPMTLYNVPALLRRAMGRKLLLKSGVSLFVDTTEAMTVIDVNSAQMVEGKNRDRAILQVNLEAAREIARLLRLRRIGGIVLIDFIDMLADEDRQAVEAALWEALQRDPVKCVIHGFTRLGLLEMTRKKAEEQLDVQGPQPCPHCLGTGCLEEKIPDEA